MKDTTPPILRRRNIKYNRLIQSAILLMCSIILGISAMQVSENEGETKKIVEKTDKKEIKKENVSDETAELSAGVSKSMLQMLKETLLQVEKKEVEIVTSAVDIEPETEIVTSAVDTEPEAEILYKSIEEIEISRDMNLTETTGISREEFCKLLANFKYDYAGFYKRNAGLIYDLSQKYQVNEIFMCGVYALESYYGSDDRHEKSHNYGSIMTKEGALVNYANDEEGIEANYQLFSVCYLSSDGKYYKGVTLDSIGNTYCPPTEDCPSWADKVYECMKVFLEEK